MVAPVGQARGPAPTKIRLTFVKAHERSHKQAILNDKNITPEVHMFKIGSFKAIGTRLNKKIERSINDFGPPFTLFSLLGLLYYCLFYFAWVVLFGTGINQEGLILRLIATFLCLGLLLRGQWPEIAKKWLPIYWYITLTYCLPFFFTWLFLHNPASLLRLMAFSSIIFWLVLLVDWVSALILFFLGVAAAIGASSLNHTVCPLTHYVYSIFSIYAGFLILVALLAKNRKHLETQKKLKTAEALGSGIAHEMRTPLSAIIMGIEGAKKYFPVLIDTYQLAKKNNLEGLQIIPSRRFEVLSTLFDDIEREAKFGHVIMDMLLCNVKPVVFKKNAAEVLKISDCIHKALQHYPFSEGQESLIHWNHDNDFSFMGSEELVVHVVLNLLKNALYYILTAGKGQIDLWQTIERKANVLHFKDTATGISQDVQDILFQQLLGHKSNRVGLGLAFCARAMQELGGSIECHTVEGEFSEFLLYFPRIKGV